MKKFTGNWCVLIFLLCLGIIPGIIYWGFSREQMEVKE